MLKARFNFRAILLSCGVVLELTGCAHTQHLSNGDTRWLLDQACRPGEDIKRVQGTVWLKVKAPDQSGQFPASVDALAPATLKLEVTNLLGGTEATVMVDHDRMEVTLPGKSRKQGNRSEGNWSGIPLRWAPDLFLGKIPCPSESDREKSKLTLTADELLRVEVPASRGFGPETFEYHFQSYAGGSWPASLTWSRSGTLGAAARVDFKFIDPEDVTQSPRRWEARSAQGEIVVRWRERNVSR